MVRPHNRPCLGTQGTPCRALTRDLSGRCENCRSRHNIARGSSTARGYNTEHRRTRGEWAPVVATGTVPCSRPGCGQLIGPGEAWDLGHDDQRRHRGPEHADCNRGRRPRQRTRQGRPPDHPAASKLTAIPQKPSF